MTDLEMLNLIKEKIDSDYVVGVRYVGSEKQVNLSAEVDWLIQKVEKGEQLEKENKRFKEINDNLLNIQHSLRDKEKEYEQWFIKASDNVNEMKSKITRYEEAFKQLKEYVMLESMEEIIDTALEVK